MARHKGARKPSAPKKPLLTHFLCVPLVTPSSRAQLESSFNRFREEVIGPTLPPVSSVSRDIDQSERKASSSRIHTHEKAIRPPGVIHLTIGVMSLSPSKLSEAVDLLRNLDVQQMLCRALHGDTVVAGQHDASNDAGASKAPSTLERPISPPAVQKSPSPLLVTLKGLESMHTQHKTSILYTAPCDPSSRLMPFCKMLRTLFTEKGFLVEDNRDLKLHATIVNTIYAKGRKRTAKRPAKQTVDKQQELVSAGDAASEDYDSAQDDRSQGHGPDANAPLKVDATAILEKYKDFVWAEDVVLDRVVICEMGAKKILDANGKMVSEEYREVAAVDLPT